MLHPLRLFSLYFVGVGLTVTSAPLHGQSCGTGQLTLQAGATLRLPSTFGIQGAEAARDGALTLWSPGGEILAVDAAHQLVVHQLPDTIRPLALIPAGRGTYRVLDAWTGRVYLVGPGTRVIATGTIERGPGEAFDRAMWHGEGWLVGLLDTHSRQYIVRQYRPDGDQVVFRSAAADSVPAIPRFLLTDTPGGLLLSRGNAPFSLYRLHPATGRIDTLPPPLADPTAYRIPADSLFLWRTASAVSLDCVLLVTLTDLTSDRRLLVRYGPDDRVDRVTALDAPVGLMLRVPGSPTVLAARRAGELELVWYDWRWIRESSSSGH